MPARDEIKVYCHLKEVLDKKKMSVYRLAAKTGINDSQLYPYVLGKRTPNIITAVRIADTLGVSLEMLWNSRKNNIEL